MYRVIIADDEPWIIEGLKATIDWHAEGFIVCGIARNGLNALSLIKQEQPDLVLIDIRMPGMNGLDVIDKIKNDCPDTHFIIISGYAEFEYARRGIEMNVSGYLLKPIEEEQLLFLVRSVHQAITIKKSEQENNALLQDAESNTGYLLDRYPEGCLIALQVGGDIASISNALLRTKIKPLHYLLVFPRSTVFDIDNLPFSIEGLGVTEYSDGMLSAAIVQAELAAYGFFNHPEQRLFYALPDQENSEEIEQFCSAAFSKNKEQIHNYFCDLRNHAAELSISSFFRMWCLLHNASNSWASIDSMVHHFGSAEKMIDYLENMLTNMPIGFISAVLDSPVQYLQEHFRESLSFTDLCAGFAMSATAMRTLISRETGTNFTQYLNSLRMEYAANLLMQSDKTINEVATTCGFEDPLYFRKVFKRFYNVSPSDFRLHAQNNS